VISAVFLVTTCHDFLNLLSSKLVLLMFDTCLPPGFLFSTDNRLDLLYPSTHRTIVNYVPICHSFSHRPHGRTYFTITAIYALSNASTQVGCYYWDFEKSLRSLREAYLITASLRCNRSSSCPTSSDDNLYRSVSTHSHPTYRAYHSILSHVEYANAIKGFPGSKLHGRVRLR
jgi:hypothetical protein